jgi:hypothetical protein
MKTKSAVRFLVAGAGVVAAQVSAAAHPYSSVAQAGGVMRGMEYHPVLSAVVNLWLLVMALILGAVIIAALIKPSAD